MMILNAANDYPGIVLPRNQLVAATAHTLMLQLLPIYLAYLVAHFPVQAP